MSASSEFILQSATVADARALAEAHIAAWREVYAGLVPDTYLAKLDVDRREQGWAQIFQNARVGEATFLMKDGDEVTGFVDVGPQRNEDLEVDGEINAIYVRKSAWGTGLGPHLMKAGAEALKDAGLSSAALWVLEDNSRACRFYEKLGGEVLDYCDEIPFDDVILTEVPYVWRDIDDLIARCDALIMK